MLVPITAAAASSNGTAPPALPVSVIAMAALEDWVRTVSRMPRPRKATTADHPEPSSRSADVGVNASNPACRVPMPRKKAPKPATA